MIVIFLVLASPALAIEGATVDVNTAKYDPFPAEPGKYVNVWLKVDNSGTSTADNVLVELQPEYPFSLDHDANRVRKIGSLGAKDFERVKYEVLVDDNAVDGKNELKVKYRACDFCMWVAEELDIEVAKATNSPEIELLRGMAEPAPYPEGKSEMTFDIVNIAPGTAYYVIVEISSDVASIEPEEIYVGNLEPDDIDSLDFDATFENVEPGVYPITFNIRYKDSDYDSFENSETVNFELKPKSDVESGKEVPLHVYAVYLIGGLTVVWLVWKRGWFRSGNEDTEETL